MTKTNPLRRLAHVGLSWALCATPLPACAGTEHELEVTATAYNSVAGQTNAEPNLTAWGDRLEPGMKSIAVSRDLIELGLTHGVGVEIEGLEGPFIVRERIVFVSLIGFVDLFGVEIARHRQMEIHVVECARAPGSQRMKIDAPVLARPIQSLDDRFQQRIVCLVHQSTHALARELPTHAKNVERDDRGGNRVQYRPTRNANAEQS